MARRDPRPCAPVQFLDRCRPSVSSAASITRQRSRTSSTSRGWYWTSAAAIPVRSTTPWSRCRSGSRSRFVSNAAGACSECRSSRSEIAAAFSRLGLNWERSDDTFVVMPPSYRFDSSLRGGPDRGGRAAAWIRPHPVAAAARPGAHAGGAGGAAVAPCGPNAAGRARLPGVDQLLVRRRPLGSRVLRQPGAHLSAQSDCGADVGHAQHAARWPGQHARIQPEPQDRPSAPVRSRTRLSARRRRCGRSTHRAGSCSAASGRRTGVRAGRRRTVGDGHTLGRLL